MSFEPPAPGANVPIPPPPNFAQGLVARSGAVVYEGGRSVFDESVMVYRARQKKQWPGFDVVDHVGRPLAVILAQGQSTMFTVMRRVIVMDLGGSPLLTVQPANKLFSNLFDVSGVASATFTKKGSGRKMSIMSNNERFGVIAGSAISGLLSDRLTILDDREQEVAVVRSFRRGRRMSQVHDFVVSVDPALRGPLRRLLIAAPPILAVVRRLHEQSAA